MENSYSQWPFVIISSLIFIIFAFSFTKPKNSRDWRSLGIFSSFIVALFAEMYGFPLTIYLLSGWLYARFPDIDLFSHNSGHLLEDFLGWGGDPHFGPFHIISYILIFYGFMLISDAWKILYGAQRNHALATAGPYARIRHPQYLGFIIIMLGFLFQWPTILTLIMFPILVWMYVRLARSEERDAKSEFGEIWDAYAKQTPAFFPIKVQINEPVKSLIWGVAATVALMFFYFSVLSLVSGWNFAQIQFSDNWYWIIALSAGFGIQIALFVYLRARHREQISGKVVIASGTTSTIAMISCCSHYLINILPIVGISGFAVIIGRYQTEFFLVGIVSNLFGIAYLIDKLVKFKLIRPKYE